MILFEEVRTRKSVNKAKIRTNRVVNKVQMIWGTFYLTVKSITTSTHTKTYTLLADGGATLMWKIK